VPPRRRPGPRRLRGAAGPRAHAARRRVLERPVPAVRPGAAGGPTGHRTGARAGGAQPARRAVHGGDDPAGARGALPGAARRGPRGGVTEVPVRTLASARRRSTLLVSTPRGGAVR